MKGLKLRLLRSMSWIAVAMALLLWAPTASLAESSSPAAQHIETYYQQLMPTLEAARHQIRLRHGDYDETGDRSCLEQLLGPPAGRGSRGLRWFSRRQLCP